MALRSFLQSLIDYAGLFPPAALPMAEAAANYARYAQAPDAWMLGRFVVPIARAAEVDASFPLSVLSSGDFPADTAHLAQLPNADSIEIKIADAQQIEAAVRALPARVHKYFEIADVSLIPIIAAHSAHGARAKIRTGGVTAGAFPAVDFVARFLRECARASVPFKATAGLHHALRCYRPLTYAPEAPCGWMYGFLNVFAAAARARDASLDELHAILLAEDLAQIPRTALGERELAIAFGSCSFEEPVADLKALGLL